jgi:hypothetical protein
LRNLADGSLAFPPLDARDPTISKVRIEAQRQRTTQPTIPWRALVVVLLCAAALAYVAHILELF